MPPKKKSKQRKAPAKKKHAINISPYHVALGNLGRVDEKAVFLKGRIHEHHSAARSPGFTFRTHLLDEKGGLTDKIPHASPSFEHPYQNLQTAKAVYGKVRYGSHAINFADAVPAFENLLVGDSMSLDVSAGTGSKMIERAFRVKATRLKGKGVE